MCRAFLDPGEPVEALGRSERSSTIGVECRSHRGRFRPGCQHLSPATVTALRGVCTKVLAGCAEALSAGAAAALGAVEPRALQDRIRIGADVTIRRTVAGQHGIDKTAGTDTPRRGRGGLAASDGGALGDVAMVHCDSFDGSVLCFGLCSTKLGTPVFPDAVFNDPVRLFLEQSQAGRGQPSQLGSHDAPTAPLGPRRPWTAGSLVIMPAATAHSRPDEVLEPDPAPAVPRWFVRATVRASIAGRRPPATEAERLAVALAVAEHCWGDPVFAAAAAAAATTAVERRPVAV